MAENKSDIINDLENYVKNLDKYHIRNFYTEDNMEDEKQEIISNSEINELIGDDITKVSDKKTGYTKTLRESLTEVDLFGNVTIKKEDWEYTTSLVEMNSINMQLPEMCSWPDKDKVCFWCRQCKC